MKKYYIKERRNSQLGTYYVACGQLTKTAARAKEDSRYGLNTMHELDTKSDYDARLCELRRDGLLLA